MFVNVCEIGRRWPEEVAAVTTGGGLSGEVE